ncbi:MAG: rod shape-determining protein RodA [Brevinema sp.]
MKDLFKGETFLFILVSMLLSAIGVLFIISTGQLENSQNTNLYLRQIVWIILGIIVSIVILSIDYYYIVETSIVYYALGVILLIVTLVIGKEIKGARSWLGFSSMGIQASEFMKLCYIVFYAKFLSNISKEEKNFQTLVQATCILILPLGLILLQPDLGTAIVFCSIFLVMSLLGLKDIQIILNALMTGILTSILILSYAYYQFYYKTVHNTEHPVFEIILDHNTFLALALILLIYATITFIIELIQQISWLSRFTRWSGILGVSFLVSGLVEKFLKPYQWNRLLVFLNPEFDRLGAGYNTIQSQIAVGSGGLFGQGIFKGSQNLRGFLPEKHTDFIFSILSEETGFMGSLFVILLYAFFLGFIVKVILIAKDREGSYIAGGLLAMYAAHICINIGMNIGVTPVTGLPLPFISYGGSFYLVCIMGVAMVLNIYQRRFVH